MEAVSGGWFVQAYMGIWKRQSWDSQLRSSVRFSFLVTSSSSCRKITPEFSVTVISKIDQQPTMPSYSTVNLYLTYLEVAQSFKYSWQKSLPHAIRYSLCEVSGVFLLLYLMSAPTLEVGKVGYRVFVWWQMSWIPALGRIDWWISEFKANSDCTKRPI